MKHLLAMNVVGKRFADLYFSNSLSKALVISKYHDVISYMFVVLLQHSVFVLTSKYSLYLAGPAVQAFPAYLMKISFKNPSDVCDGPFQYAHDTKVHFSRS